MTYAKQEVGEMGNCCLEKLVQAICTWKIIIYIEIRKEKLSKVHGIAPSRVTDLSENNRDILSVLPGTLTKSKASVTS